jgi:hypothetical protein
LRAWREGQGKGAGREGDAVDQISQFLFPLVDADHFVADAVPHGVVLLLASLETAWGVAYSMTRLRFSVAIFMIDRQYCNSQALSRQIISATVSVVMLGEFLICLRAGGST